MSRRKREAERYFAESLRAQTFTPKVNTNYTYLEDVRRTQRGRSAIFAGLIVLSFAFLIAELVSAV